MNDLFEVYFKYSDKEIKASPFSTRNVPKRYVGIKKSVAGAR